VQILFTDRRGGVSAPPFSSFNLGGHVGDDPAAVAENRRRLRERVGGDVVYMDQVHSATVGIVERADQPFPATDGLVTQLPGVALAVLVADCVPILAWDEGEAVIGAAHAGRRGAAAGIAVSMIDAMLRLGARRRRIRVALGPAICGSCYEVPGEMRDEVDAALPGSGSVTRTGTPALDLRAGLGRQLTSLGVADVATDPRCTREDASLFSHRREAPTGRQAGVIRLDAPPA
jgi:YfiH family protein